MQPAFNPVVFVTDGNEFTFNANASGSVYDKITIEAEKINGRATYDISSFMQAYFSSDKSPYNNMDWIYLDRRLFAIYSVAGVRRSVINAVQMKGQTIDLLKDGVDCLLTTRPRVDGKIKIPVYPGFPSGICVAYRDAYKEAASFNIVLESSTMSRGQIQKITINSNTFWEVTPSIGYVVSESSGFGNREIFLKALDNAEDGLALSFGYANAGAKDINIIIK